MINVNQLQGNFILLIFQYEILFWGPFSVHVLFYIHQYNSSSYNLPHHRSYLRNLLLFSCSVMSDSLWPHGLQHARLPCPSLSPGLCSNSCPLSWWCHPTISSSVSPLLLLTSIFHRVRVFSIELALCIRWPKYWSFIFRISPSSEYSGFISFRIDWFNLCVVHKTLRILLQHHSSKASVLHCSAFFYDLESI